MSDLTFWITAYLLCGALILCLCMTVPGAWSIFRNNSRVLRFFIVVEALLIWPIGLVVVAYKMLRR
jgi:hypothetical protein